MLIPHEDKVAVFTTSNILFIEGEDSLCDGDQNVMTKMMMMMMMMMMMIMMMTIGSVERFRVGAYMLIHSFCIAMIHLFLFGEYWTVL